MMAENESEAVRCLERMSEETAVDSGKETENIVVEIEETNASQNDHDYVDVEGVPGDERVQHASNITIVNRTTDGVSPATTAGLATADGGELQTQSLSTDKTQQEDVPVFTPSQDQTTVSVNVVTEPHHDAKVRTSSCSPWTKIGTWSSAFRGHFVKNEDIDKAIKIYTEETDSRWVVCAKDRLFGAQDIKLSNFKLFWKGREDNRKAAFPEFDEIPFIMVGRKTWGCHLGRDKCRSGKIKYRTKMQEENQEGETEKWPLIRSSKKLGCPAMISSVHVLKFHEYPIKESTSEFHRKQTLKKLRQSLLSKHSIVKAEQRFYIHLADPEDHIHDSNSLQDGNSSSIKVDKRLIYKITELHHSGMFRLAEVSRVLEYYRKQLYKDDEPPSEKLIPELHPNPNCIHFFISNAVRVTSILEMDLGHGHRLVSGWQTAYPNDSWYYQPFASSGPIKRAKNKKDVRLVNHYPDLTQTFLFCCQNATQRRLLNTYGSVCILDSPQGKTALPSYFLMVRTNIGYQVVCTILMQYWNSQALVDALQVLRDWNPEWQPQAILVDLIEDEIEVLEKLFPESKICISFVHRERAWKEFLEASKEEDREAESSLLDSLVYAQTEEEVEQQLKNVQESPLWKKNPRLKHWVSARWLPCIKRWSYAFISKHLLVTMCANGGLNRLREALDYGWLEGVRSRTLSEHLTSLVMVQLCKLYERHCEDNKMLSECSRYQHISRLPVYIRHQPVSARACTNQVISGMPPMKVVEESEGRFLVQDEFNECRVFFGSESEFPSCDCWMWNATMEICYHFAAVFKECKKWHWCQLSPLYTGNLIFKLDQTTLDAPPRDMPRCGEEVLLETQPDYVQPTVDDFGAEEILMGDSGEDNVGGNIAEPTWQVDDKQTACKGLLDQLGQLTEQMEDPEAMDYMTSNLVVLLKQMQGKKGDTPSPKKQKGRKKSHSGSKR